MKWIYFDQAVKSDPIQTSDSGEDLFSPMETLSKLRWESIFGQEPTLVFRFVQLKRTIIDALVF